MGEGAIEGVAEDYEIDAENHFSTEFKYTRFNATRASPRNVAALTGVHRDVKADQTAAGLEGATVQGDDVVADPSAIGAAAE